MISIGKKIFQAIIGLFICSILLVSFNEAYAQGPADPSDFEDPDENTGGGSTGGGSTGGGSTGGGSTGGGSTGGGPAPTTRPATPVTSYTLNYDQCGKAIITLASKPSEAGVLWYLFSSSSMPSTSYPPSGTPSGGSGQKLVYTVNSSARRYLRAFNGGAPSGQEWSTGTRAIDISSTNFKTIPSTPVLSDVSKNESCGATLLIIDNHPSNAKSHWQKNADTRTITGSTINRTSGNKYYLRAQHNTSDCWSGLLPVSYSIKEIPADPPKPEEEVRSPGITTLIMPDTPDIPGSPGTPDPNIIFHWQDTEEGNVRGNTDPEYNVYSNGRVWLQAEHFLSKCWSGTTPVDYTVDFSPPPPKTLPPLFKCDTTVYRFDMASKPDDEDWLWKTDPNDIEYRQSDINDDFSILNEILVPKLYLYARNKVTGYWSTALEIDTYIKKSPATLFPTGASNVCFYNDVTIYANAGNNQNLTVKWYEDAHLNNLAGIGSSLTITQIEDDQTYYVQSELNGCLSSSSPVSVTLKADNNAPLIVDVLNPDPCEAKQIKNPIAGPPADPTQDVSQWYLLGREDVYKENLDLAQEFGGTIITIAETGNYYFAQSANGGACFGKPQSEEIHVGDKPKTSGFTLTDNECGPDQIALVEIANQEYIYDNVPLIEISEENYEISKSGQYQIKTKSTFGCTEEKILFDGFLDVTLYPDVPILDGGGPLLDDPGYYNKVKIVNPEDDVIYEIYQGQTLEDKIEFGNHSSKALANGNYTVTAIRESTGGSGEIIASCPIDVAGVIAISEAHLVVEDQSFFATKQYLSPITEEQLNEIAEEEIIRSISYIDGHGRPIQQIVKNATSDQEDIVSHIEYDDFGRQLERYLPFVENYDGFYHTSTTAKSDLLDFYSEESDVVQDTRPFSEIEYDDSPLNRVESVQGPGQNWEGVKATQEYRNNSAEDQVAIWKIDEHGELFRAGTYPPRKLRKLLATSEDDHQTITFVNQSGQLILKKEQAPNGQWALTYNVYDEFGNLRFVLPPLALAEFYDDSFGSPEIPDGYYFVDTDTNYESIAAEAQGKVVVSSARTLTINAGTTLEAGSDIYIMDIDAHNALTNQHFLVDQIFQYEYDHRHRLIAKRVPGSDWVYMVYDERDRIVLTQDGNQRLDNKYSFIKYDFLNRPIITGEKEIAGDLNAIRADVAASAVFFDAYDQSGLVKYSDNSYPQGLSVEDILSVSYFDDYRFTSETFVYPEDVFNSLENKILPSQSTFGVKGLATGSMVKISGTNDQFVSTVNFYDDNYRLAQTVTHNHKGRIDRMTPQYNWKGQLKMAYVQYEGIDADLGDINITQTYAYDRMGRHLTTTHQLGSGSVKTIVNNTYNALGQLVNKSVTDQLEGIGDTEYAYNIRGWIKQINDPNDGVDHLFEMEFKYEDALHQKYDGTIGSVTWKNPYESGINTFDYKYDELNRITSAIGGGEAFNMNLDSISYDLQGNILHLQRRGVHDDQENQLFDELAYTYDEFTNRLTSVTDASTMSSGFDDGNTEGDDYAYDANGNLISDKNKGITAIEYNHLNQPTKVTYDANKYMEYTYAGAAKVSQRLVDGAIEKTTDYIGGMVYENDKLQFIAHDQGRVVAERDVNDDFVEYEYQYHLTDHLGNIRVTFKTDIDEDNYQATFEPANQSNEVNYFTGYEGMTKITADLFNHTSGGNTSIRLNGSANEKEGLGKSLKVKPGDVIDMEVYAKYFDNSNSGGWTNALNTLAANIAANSGGIVVDGGGIGVDAFPFADWSGKSNPSGAPQAYINYMVFDDNYLLIPELTGYQQISSAAEENGTDVDHEKLSHSLSITKAGYVYIYLSNENPTTVDVFFDDFTVTQTHTPVIQKDDYYPFGLSFNSYTRAAITDQNFKFNAGSELEKMTDWYSTPFRKYDPSLGRFHGVDALASMYPSISPSAFVSNNPIMFVDPSGLTQDDGDGDPSGGGGGFDPDNCDICMDELVVEDTRIFDPFIFSGYQGNSQSVFFSHPEGTTYTGNMNIPSGGGGGASRPASTITYLSAKTDYVIPQTKKPTIDLVPINVEIFDLQGAMDIFWSSNMGQDLSGIDWSNTASLFLNGMGFASTTSELSSIRNGMWKGLNGKWYSMSWGGNGAAGARSAIEKVAAPAKALGRRIFFISAGLSLFEYSNNPNMQQGAKSTVEIGYGALGTFGGPFGWALSGLHFADQFLQSTIPGYTEFMTAGGGIGGATYMGSDGVYVCFTSGTLIYTAEGLRPIEELKEGVKVYSYNFSTDSIELQPVTKFFTRQVEEIYEVKAGNEQISVTEEHPFYVKGKEWVKVKDLVSGDQLQSDLGYAVEISSTNKTNKSVKVYNIEVAGNHNYFVTSSKVLVHNKNIVELESETSETFDQPKFEKE